MFVDRGKIYLFSMTSESNSPKERFPNSKMRAIIDRAIREKASNPIFLVGIEERTIPTSSYSNGQLAAYTAALNKWAGNPVSPSGGIEGHAYDLLVVEVLRVLYPTQTVIHSPASLDFGPGRHYGPSVDIIMGDIHNKDVIIPNMLITTALSDKEKHRPTTRQHGFLHAPIVFLPATIFFPNIRDQLVDFGLNKDPIKVVNTLALQTRLPLLQALSNS